MVTVKIYQFIVAFSVEMCNRSVADGGMVKSFPRWFFGFPQGFSKVFDHRSVEWGKVFHTFNRVFNIFNVDNAYTLWITAFEYTFCEQGMNSL